MTKTATLCYVIKNGKILLIRKKRGIGAGKYNGPGGHIEQNETPLECAIRETREELGITPLNAKQIGYNEFFAGDKPFMNVFVFTADGYSGELIETDEAAPFWFPLDKLPMKEMWQDDEIWFPLMFAGKRFKGKFWFDAKLEKLERHELKRE